MRNAIVRAFAVVTLGVAPIAHAQEDRDMNSLYEDMLETFDIPHRDLLERAQQAWSDYRDATCELIAERPGHPEVAASALESCLACLARERTAELRLIRLSQPAP
jgi:uncharacterized protein YecT (DUF1311 family)